MAELPAFIARRDIARVPAGRGGRRGASLPGVPQRAAPDPLAALAEASRQVQAFGEQFQRIQDAVLSDEATIRAFNELGAVDNAIAADLSLNPLDRGPRYQEEAQRVLERAGEGLSPTAQTEIQRRLTPQILRRAASLRDAGRKELIERGMTATEVMLTHVGNELLAATSEEEQRVALANARDIISGAVQHGFLSPAAGTQRLQVFRHDAALQQAELLARTDPEAALEQFLQGPAAQPLLAQDLPALIDTAQTERSQQIAFAEHEEKIARRKGEEDESQRYFVALDALYALREQDAAPTAYIAWMQAFRDKRTEYGEHFDEGLAKAQSLLTAAEKPDEIQYDPRHLAQLINGLYGPERYMDATDIARAIANNLIDPAPGLQLFKDQDQIKSRYALQNVWEFQRGFKMLEESVAGVVGGIDRLYDERNNASLQRWIEVQNVYINAARSLYNQGMNPQESADFVARGIMPIVMNLVEDYTIQFRALQLAQQPDLPFGLEHIFQTEGLEAAKERLRLLRDTPGNPISARPLEELARETAEGRIVPRDDTVYKSLLRHLRRREELGWTGGGQEKPGLTPQRRD